MPYHRDIAESGRAFQRFATLNLSAFDDTSVDAEFKSKMLGQAGISTDRQGRCRAGRCCDVEPDADVLAGHQTARCPAGRCLDAEATAGRTRIRVRWTRSSGRSATATWRPSISSAGRHVTELKNEQGTYALNHAVLFCGQDAATASAVIVALVKAKGDITTKDPDNKTTPLVGSVQSCSVDAVQALIAAGSDLSAKSAGGMTALQLADIFGRPEIAAALRKAGAK